MGYGYDTQGVGHVEDEKNVLQTIMMKIVILPMLNRSPSIYRCECRFIWCCEVKCKACVTRHDLHTCK